MTHILVVDDVQDIRELLADVLNDAGYEFDLACSQEEAVKLLSGKQVYDIVVTDMRMEHEDSGLAVLIAANKRDNPPEVIVLTGYAEVEGAVAALKLGAYWYLSKDAEGTQHDESVTDRLLALIERATLWRRVRRDDPDALIEVLIRLMKATDPYTANHSQEVGQLVAKMARSLGWGSNGIKRAHFAGLLHDIGKIAVDGFVLNKAGRLSKAERAMMEAHVTIGKDIFSGISVLEGLVPAVYQHHELYAPEKHEAGFSGYPREVCGNDIDPIAAMIAVADSYDAITSDRAYRPACKKEEAIQKITEEKGKQFAPFAVEAFLAVINNPDDETLDCIQSFG